MFFVFVVLYCCLLLFVVACCCLLLLVFAVVAVVVVGLLLLVGKIWNKGFKTILSLTFHQFKTLIFEGMSILFVVEDTSCDT